MTDQEACFYRTLDDEALFNRATAGLPTRAPDEPYHCGPHNVRGFRVAITNQMQAKVLEIGFNLGHSAALMLELGAERVHSIDIRGTDRQKEAAGNLMIRHSLNSTCKQPPIKFTVQLDCTVLTCSPPPFTPTLAYIDGDHTYEGVMADIAYCRSLGITRYLFDDILPVWGPGVQKAIYASNLLPMAIVGSMAYCVVAEAEGYFKPDNI